MMRIIPLALLAGLSACAAAQTTPKPPSEEERVFGDRKPYRQDGLIVRHAARTPDGMAAFYLGRGFPKAAVDETRQACFIGFFVRNERPDRVWFDLSRWSFLDPHGRPIPRLTHDDWGRRWERLDIPMRFRATFGWTLAPEVRDLHPDEPVGGNVTLRPVQGPIRVVAVFPTGVNRQGPVIRIRFDGLRCLRDRR